MLGQFLELSVQADNIIESIGFYEALGFKQLSVGEVWQHPYAVLSDGRLQIGLHQYEFESPALTFVRPDLAKFAPELRMRGADFAFSKLDPDEFNELGFLDPGGQMITLLEARTFSPPPFDFSCHTFLGAFHCFRLPGKNVEASAGFWERLGFEVHEDDGRQLLSGSGLVLSADGQGDATLMFDGDVESFATGAARLGLTEARISADGASGSLRSPDGLNLVVRQR